ncbi:GFA family protein [Pseudorhodoplanes sp.]|jgi:hypothetical protein|uniref:GFA family protein n=1 Tax=Pseudorhodoplanes sp. TaxID=1934341 RepID=UPI002BF7538F|nr:GFA family protein [Pseudorhodoplanes sp.]HWV41148.1 GFA family protein [Pseudorhodoplanes sp.]
MAESKSGGCLCGAVRFTATPANDDVGACHCSICRRWSAGPFMVRDCGTSLKIEDASKAGVYRSSEWAERGFCKTCGTTLYYRLIDKDMYFVSAEAFDDVKTLAFTSQVFIDEKPAYYDFANKTHNMTGAEVFALFAPGGDEARG